MNQFLQGFALVQMLPGPLFNLSAYVGAIYLGVPGAFVGWVGLFLPGFLLVIALLPLWDRIRKVGPFTTKPPGVGLSCIIINTLPSHVNLDMRCTALRSLTSATLA
jgi:chromate transporter